MIDRRLVDGFRKIVGPDGVISSPDELLVYECDMLTYHRGTPDLVVLPRTTAQVSQVVTLAAEAGLPIVPRGSGTGLIGGAMAPEGGVMIGLNRMDRILEVDFRNRLAVVEPGLINLWLTQAIQERGFYFAPDPSSQMVSSIGGNVSTNAGGPHCLKYGVTANHVLGLEVVLADGRIVSFGGKVSDLPGYDLAGVFVGTEGTIGIVTKVIVRLLPSPEGVKTILASFDGIEPASAAVSGIIARGIVPAALELMDEHVIRAVEAGIHAGYPSDAKAVLLIELDGPAAEVEAETPGVVELCQANGVLDLRVAKSEEERVLLWKGRKEAAGAVGRITHNYVLQDAVVPRSRLPQIMHELSGIGRRYGLMIANVFHAGDGNLHPLVCYDERVPGQLEKALAASDELLKACIALGGAVTGEHGVGLDKAKCLPLMYSEADLDAMLRLRRLFDPAGIMNPLKIFPSPRACQEVSASSGKMPAGPGLWV